MRARFNMLNNIRTMKRLLLLFLICTCAHAQTQTTTIEVRLLALGSANSMPERYLSTKDGFEEVTYSSRQASQTIEAYIDEQLPLFKKSANPNARSGYEVADQIKLPPESKSVLLLCWNTPEGQKFHAINDSILKAEYNTWLMINTTAKAVGFRIGENEKPVFLEPNSIKNYTVTAEEGKGVPVWGRAEFDGNIKTFYSTYWRIRENERSIVIFNEVGNKIRVKKIGDRLVRNNETTSQTSR